MKTMLLKKWKCWVSVAFCLLIFLFWWQCYPHALSYQEQYQLFLWTGDYLSDSLRIPGGLAAYLGEFVVQFYYVEWLGALLLAILFVLTQWLTWRNMHTDKPQWYPLSFATPVLLLWLMGDESVLLSYVVALIAVLTTALLIPRGKTGWKHQLADFLLVAVLYWLFGPMTLLYVTLRLIRGGWKSAWTVVYLPLLMLLTYRFLLPQWSMASVFTGMVYYRIPETGCAMMWILPMVTLTVCCLSRLGTFRFQWMGEVALLAVVAWLAMSMGYEREKYELIRQDYLVRNERWDEIIDRASEYQVKTPFSSVCVNLALAQRRQLADRMFDFWQSGPDALVMPRQRDLTSMLPSAEVFWHLGMVNSAQRYMFDTQESILNARKSGRCTKRIVECMLVNGHYKPAAKHIDLLKKSLFYRSWAADAETYLNNEAKISQHPVWGKKRRYRFRDNFLYSPLELDKILGMLFMNNPENKMALDYSLAQMLLNGNVPVFLQNLQLAQRYGGYTSMPRGYQDVVNCARSGGAAENSPYMNFFQRMRQVKQ